MLAGLVRNEAFWAAVAASVTVLGLFWQIHTDRSERLARQRSEVDSTLSVEVTLFLCDRRQRPVTSVVCLSPDGRTKLKPDEAGCVRVPIAWKKVSIRDEDTLAEMAVVEVGAGVTQPVRVTISRNAR